MVNYVIWRLIEADAIVVVCYVVSINSVVWRLKQPHAFPVVVCCYVVFRNAIIVGMLKQPYTISIVCYVVSRNAVIVAIPTQPDAIPVACCYVVSRNGVACRNFELNPKQVVCYFVSTYTVAWRHIEPNAVIECPYFHVFDCYSASRQGDSFSASCSLNCVACSINHNVISLHNNRIINVVCEGVDVSVSLNLICSLNRPIWSDVYSSTCFNWLNVKCQR